MTIEQRTFLGSSIRFYTGSVGWNDQVGELKVGLVDDPSNGDAFQGYPLSDNPQYYVGNAGIFQHYDFTFGGILHSMERVRGAEGNPLYEVTIRDPRFILEGVQLILDGYSGGIAGFTNIFNIFGYLESFGFGNSNVNEGGMPWYAIAAGLGELLDGYSPGYGQYISYRGEYFGVYIDNLPALPLSYRIGGGDISLLDYVQDICDAGGMDWYCNLENNPNYVAGGFAPRFLIMIHTISRLNPDGMVFGKIAEYTANVQGCVANSVGVELLDSITKKMVVGGAKEDLWAVPFSNGQFDYNNNIWPYWGLNSAGNIITGTGNGDDHKFVIDSSLWAVYGIGNNYSTDVPEMRAALDSQESWEAFLWMRNSGNYPQAGRASTIGLITELNGNTSNMLSSKLSVTQLQNLTKNNMNDSTDFDSNKNKQNLYDLVRSYAQDYFGKKFMVKIPNISTSYSPESNQLKLSREIVESAYLADDMDLPSMISNGYVPQDINNFTNSEGKFSAYVRFDNAIQYDFSEIGEDDRCIETNGSTYIVFVKCQVDSTPVYLNSATGYSPRAVVTLPGVVRVATNPNGTQENNNVSIIKEFLTNKGVSSTKINALLSGLGGDSIAFGREAQAVIPSFAVVPMRSNIECYGPWYSYSWVDGKVEFEKDETLTPWTFGSREVMDEVGIAKTSQVFSAQAMSETGSVEFPDIPNRNLGQQLEMSGPYVSDISVTVGPDGYKTTFRFQRYTPSFGKLSRSYIDRLTRVGKAQQTARRHIRDLYKKQNRVAGLSSIKANFFKSLKAKRDKSNSSHIMISGQVRGDTSEGFAIDVVSQPPYNAVTQLSSDYANIGGVSYDGIFRPIATDTSSGGKLGHFETPTAQGLAGTEPTVNNLHPYQAGHDIQSVVHGTTVPNDLCIANNGAPAKTAYRPIALKGPLIVTGWGYDINGKPVPNATPSDPGDDELENALQRSDMWKTGPVDMRWDDDRKVWVAGGGGGAVIVMVLPDGIVSPIASPYTSTYRKVYRCQKYNISFSNTAGSDASLVATSSYIYAANFRSLVVLTNRFYIAYKIGGKYVLDVQADFTDA